MLTVLFCSVKSANAFDTPIYRDRLEASALLKISNYLSEQNQSKDKFKYAEIDLNDDSFPEYLLKTTRCSATDGFCTFAILAEKKGEITPLLNLKAKDVTISDTKTNGIHDILAIQSKKNDYKYLRYVWSPVDMIFKPADRQIEGQ